MSCLTDVTPKEWYEILNRRVFFWLTAERLSKLLNARAYKNNTHCVLTVDTKLLLESHLDSITLSPINSGSTLYDPPRRGRATFLKPDAYPFHERKRLRGRANAIAELAVDYKVSDLEGLVVRVDHMKRDVVKKKIYQR